MYSVDSGVHSSIRHEALNEVATQGHKVERGTFARLRKRAKVDEISFLPEPRITTRVPLGSRPATGLSSTTRHRAFLAITTHLVADGRDLDPEGPGPNLLLDPPILTP